MNTFKCELVRCLTSLGTAPEVITECIRILQSSAKEILIRHYDSGKASRSLTVSTTDCKWIFFPEFQKSNSPNSVDTPIHSHPYFRATNHSLYTIQQHLVALLLYNTRICHESLIIDNPDVFHQSNGSHPDDDLFYIPSLYCCPIKYYLSTPHFVDLLRALHLESVLVESLISSVIPYPDSKLSKDDQSNSHKFDIFSWIHHQYRNAQHQEYASRPMDFKVHGIECILSEIQKNESHLHFIPLILEFCISLLSKVNQTSLRIVPTKNESKNFQELKYDRNVINVLHSALDILKGLKLSDSTAVTTQWTLFHSHLHLFVLLTMQRKESMIKMDWEFIKTALSVSKSMNALCINGIEDNCIDMVFKGLILSISDIMEDINDDTDLQSHFGRYFHFETDQSDNELFYCQVLLALKSSIFRFEQNLNQINRADISMDIDQCLISIFAQFEEECQCWNECINEWKKQMISLSFSQIIHILSHPEHGMDGHHEHSNVMNIALDQLIDRGYTNPMHFSMEIHEYHDVYSTMEMSIEWINSLKLCQMIHHLFQFASDRNLETNRTTSKWKQLFLTSYSLLPSMDQHIITKQIYLNPVSIDDDESNLNDRILLFFNSLLNDSDHDVSTLREFSIIALLSPHRTIDAIISNLILHPKYAKLLAEMLLKFPILLYLENLMWSKLENLCLDSLGNDVTQPMEHRMARCITIFVDTLIGCHYDILYMGYPLKLFVIPTLTRCVEEYGMMLRDNIGNIGTDNSLNSIRRSNVILLMDSVVTPIITKISSTVLVIPNGGCMGTDSMRSEDDICNLLDRSWNSVRKYISKNDAVEHVTPEPESQGVGVIEHCIECLEMLLEINDTIKLKGFWMEMVGAAQRCMPLCVDLLSRVPSLWSEEQQTAFQCNMRAYSGKERWTNMLRVRSLFKGQCLGIGTVLMKEKVLRFWTNLMAIYDDYDHCNQSDNSSGSNGGDSDITNKVKQLNRELKEYDIGLLDIASIDDESSHVAVMLVMNHECLQTVNFIEFINVQLIPDLVRKLPAFTESELRRVLIYFVLRICGHSTDYDLTLSSPLEEMSKENENVLFAILILFRSIHRLIADVDIEQQAIERSLNCCLRVIQEIVTLSDGSGDGNMLHEVGMRYCVYRQCTDLLARLCTMGWNTNFVFIFLCDNVTNILERLRRGLDTKEETNGKEKRDENGIRRTVEEICVLLELEMHQLPARFSSMLSKIVDQFTGNLN